MILYFVTNARFTMASDGCIYGIHTSINSSTFQHYLRTYNKVKVIARVEKVDYNDFPESTKLCNDRIELLPLPYFIGPIQFILQRSNIKRVLAEYLNEEGVTICRVPGTLGRLAADYLYSKKIPFGVEVAGDPYELFAPGSMNSVLRVPLRILGVYHLKRIVKNASAALYVTKNQLQKRYPVRKGVLSTYASNVLLLDNAFARATKSLAYKHNYKIISVGTLDQMYKGPDILLNAVEIINNKDLPFKVSLVWLGEGRYREEMESLAKKHDITKFVSFVGIVKPFERVKAYLDSADLFVLASRTEGLPRAMIEAMARGLPCVGTRVGGIPELLNDEYLVPVNNSRYLAERIISFLTDKVFYDSASKNNLKNARRFHYEKLNQRRAFFYEKLLTLTKADLEKKKHLLGLFEDKELKQL